MIGTLIRIAGFLYFRIFFAFVLRKTKHRNVVVFDLDNTVFNTWPLRKKYKRDQDVYSHAEPFAKVLELIKNYYQRDYQLIFLTARHYLYYFLTLRNIERYLPHMSGKNLILVPEAKDKIYFMRKLAEKYSAVELYDDLSYNHENGEVKIHKHVIEQIKSLNVKYFGIDFLRPLQEDEDNN